MRGGSVVQITSPTMATVPVPLCSASQSRKALVIGVDSGIGYVSPVQGVVAGVGFPITAGYPMTFDIETYGNIVQQTWFGSGSVNTVKFGVIEIIG